MSKINKGTYVQQPTYYHSHVYPLWMVDYEGWLNGAQLNVSGCPICIEDAKQPLPRERENDFCERRTHKNATRGAVPTSDVILRRGATAALHRTTSSRQYYAVLIQT